MTDWLHSLGFVRGNPFAAAEAEQERGLLPEYFVDFDEYEQIRGEKISLVSAARGGGKSALRVMLASQCAPWAPGASELAAEYVDFDPLLVKVREGQKLSIDDHLARLLRAGAGALLEALCGPAAVDREPGQERAAETSPPDRSRLARLLRTYHPTQICPEALFERLAAFEPGIHSFWEPYFSAAVARRLARWIDQFPGLASQPVPRLLADLNDAPGPVEDPGISPREKMSAFSSLARRAGFTRVVFLVDRLDEHMETTADPEVQADILEPLLAHLPVLEEPGLSFKFMLSDEARAVLFARSKLRLDRMAVRSFTLSWPDQRLKQLLQERLLAYSERQVPDLITLCQDVSVRRGSGQTERRLGEWIENEILSISQGSPRSLLLACQELCEVHLERHPLPGLIEEEDWLEAKRRIKLKSEARPPAPAYLPLRLSRGSQIVRIGEREIRLSKQQHQILLALAEAGGLNPREALVEQVWQAEDGISEEAVDQAISRLRQRLGDSRINPRYLHILKGTGIRLTNYILE